MNFAGKYYALSAFRISTNKEFVDHVEKSLAQIFYADFKQGSWFSALNIYDLYINLREQSNIEKSDYEEESKITQRLSLILHAMKRISLQYNYFVEDYIIYLDYIGEDIIKPIFKLLDNQFESDDNFLKLLEKKFDDFPLNDIGKQRIISFYALGSLWKITFENNYEITSVAEEYIANIQIILAEISLSGFDFHLLKSTIEIELILSNTATPPEEIPENNFVKWQVSICHFDDSDPLEINKHTVFNTMSFHLILNAISLLKEKEFNDLLFKLIRERALDKKQIAINLYQRIYRDIYTKENFEFTKRDLFQKEDINLNLPTENRVMKWNDSLSKKYNQEFSLNAIKNRFNNSYNSIYITLNSLKENIDFSTLINQYRAIGWKDWQIISNIYNFIIDYKVKYFENSNYENIEESQKLINKYRKLDEKNCLIKFPLEAFKSKEFITQFDISMSTILITNGLVCKSSTPNFKAIKEFLDIRFNMANDVYNENNPLSEIIFE